MRLTKTLNIIETKLSDTPTGVDQFDRPTFEDIPTKTPFLGEKEPFSTNLAETIYGIFAEVTDRVFCLPNEKIKEKSIIEFKGEYYEVSKPPIKYDNHYEVLIKKVK